MTQPNETLVVGGEEAPVGAKPLARPSSERRPLRRYTYGEVWESQFRDDHRHEWELVGYVHEGTNVEGCARCPGLRVRQRDMREGARG